MYSTPAADRHPAMKDPSFRGFPGSWDPIGVQELVDRDVDLAGDHKGLTQALISLLSNADECLEQNRPAAKSCINRALSILEAERRRRLVVSEPQVAPARGGLSPGDVRRIRGHIDEHLDSSILIDDLTAIVRLSVRHFSLAFKQSFGQPPHAYIVRRRIERAQQLMLLTDEPLAQIAVACGLADQSHLSKWFRRLLGVSPGAWRKVRRA